MQLMSEPRGEVREMAGLSGIVMWLLGPEHLWEEKEMRDKYWVVNNYVATTTRILQRCVGPPP